MTNKTEIAAKLNNLEGIQVIAAEIAAATDDDAVLEILRQHNLELTAEELRAFVNDEEELDEDLLDNVAGGCNCKGILKRAFTNLLSRIGKSLGINFTCPDCGK